MFVTRMNDQEKQALYNVVSECGRLLDSLGHPWWLSHGTLLGAWRHHDVIPWDDDLDVAFPREKLPELIAAAAESGWKFCRLGPFLAKIWNPSLALYHTNHPWTWPFADITLYDETSTTIIVEYMYHRKFAVVEKSDVLPLQDIPFGPLQLPVPRSPELLLNQVYPYWNSQPSSSDYGHRMERSYDEPSERRRIADLAKDFQMFNVDVSDSDATLVEVCHGEHPQWAGPVHFFSDGRMCRPNSDEGRYEKIGDHGMVLFWDQWEPEILIRKDSTSPYRDPTKPFFLQAR
ncbi:LicD family protein [Roseimaritima multifibrata]|uniref:LicD family protein n=2 Tax=Roseimaritima multifibrata TaxID=1930274 RepID=A0A517MC26_9BACT|nr:LicD family protein [Roseimaritima multifibrata]